MFTRKVKGRQGESTLCVDFGSLNLCYDMSEEEEKMDCKLVEYIMLIISAIS